MRRKGDPRAKARWRLERTNSERRGTGCQIILRKYREKDKENSKREGFELYMRGFAGLAQSDAAILAGECSNLPRFCSKFCCK